MALRKTRAIADRMARDLAIVSTMLRRRPTWRRRYLPIAPDLLTQPFSAPKPNRIWLAERTRWADRLAMSTILNLPNLSRRQGQDSLIGTRR